MGVLNPSSPVVGQPFESVSPRSARPVRPSGKPSALYRAVPWRAGVLAARFLPRGVLERIGICLALAYHKQHDARRETVTRNLLPPLNGNRAAAEKICRALFAQFGRKLADLWRYESGCDPAGLMTAPDHWYRLETARARGRGLLLLTPHIGNWEFGAPFLRQRGVPLHVITQAEPDDVLTRMREASRARRGIETIVIGENSFAFVEVIRRLESGAAVALLVDRPHPASAARVQLFGRDFAASIAPAELARATGCALLPVCLPRMGRNYSVELLPEIVYDRAALRSREARLRLTQKIMRQFEPLIHRNLDQWFHFVPLWNETAEEKL